MNIPRNEYPRPQFKREQWRCLNGTWQFEIDQADTGEERGLLSQLLTHCIEVPFCPESRLSGIGHTDFMNAVFYRRYVDIPAEWAPQRVLLHFQAVDYETTVWVNGCEVQRHRGGYTPFTCDLHCVAEPGDRAEIVVRARDRKGEPKPSGKQAFAYCNQGCFYTRTTGIWQTVWMEPTFEVYMKRPRITPDVANHSFRIAVPLSQSRAGYALRAELRWRERPIAEAHCNLGHDFCAQMDLRIPDDEVHLWGPGVPNLYDLRLELIDEKGSVVDAFDSYAGLRGVAIDGRAVLINGKPVFQRQVLDQGFYEDGICTAPTDEALRQDIVCSMDVGFNSARLHERVFEERFLYHADQLGYLVWGEFGDWGMWALDKACIAYRHQPHAALIVQWLEALDRDYSHPCVVGWCALNEEAYPITSEMDSLDDAQRGAFLAAKAMDPTRPVLDVSGHGHRLRESDVYDVHDYTQDPLELARRYSNLAQGSVTQPHKPEAGVPYAGQPFFVSEFGGIKWPPGNNSTTESWGYGETPQTMDAFYERFAALCHALMDNPHIFGFCYTQLTDVFQEQNGLFAFDRRPKFDPARLRQALTAPAAIEKNTGYQKSSSDVSSGSARGSS